MRRGKLQPLAVIAVFIAVAAFQFWNRQSHPDAVTPRATLPSSGPAAVESRGDVAPATTPDRLSAVDPSERAQVEKTLALIAHGGPFLHRQDGAVFSNREGHLPQKPSGYYREYTVETPGADTRGARRIVRGDGGETYYTNDHYRTFVRIE